MAVKQLMLKDLRHDAGSVEYRTKNVFYSLFRALLWVQTRAALAGVRFGKSSVNQALRVLVQAVKALISVRSAKKEARALTLLLMRAGRDQEKKELLLEQAKVRALGLVRKLMEAHLMANALAQEWTTLASAAQTIKEIESWAKWLLGQLGGQLAESETATRIGGN